MPTSPDDGGSDRAATRQKQTRVKTGCLTCRQRYDTVQDKQSEITKPDPLARRSVIVNDQDVVTAKG